MRWPIVLSVYRKEIRETLRDRRTLVMMVGLPLVLYPLMILFLGQLRESQRESAESKPSVIAVWGELPPALAARIATGKIELKPWQGVTAEVRSRLEAGSMPPVPPPPFLRPGEKRIPPMQPDADHPLTVAARPIVLNRSVDAVLVAWPDVRSSAEAGALGNVSILFDSVRDGSRLAEQRLNAEIAEYRRDLLREREKSRGLPDGFTRGLAVVSKNVATEARRAGFGLGQLLPFLLITVTFSGAFYASIDTTAGEKERGTLQTLLCAPVTSAEIIGGKFFAVWTVALVSAVANVVSLSMTLSQVVKQAGGTLAVQPSAYLISLAMLVPVSLMITAIFLAVGVFAKDFKDGQNFLSPVLMGIMLPSAAAMIPGIEINAWSAFLPIVNIALLMKAMFIAEAKPDMVFLVLLASTLYASLAVLFAARVFERESILLGGKDTARGLFGIDRLAGAKPTPSLAVAVFAVCLVLGFYAGAGTLRFGLPAALAITQYGAFLLPVIAVVVGLRFAPEETLRLRAPGWRGLIAGAVIGLTGWTVAFPLIRVIPPPESFQKALEKFLLLDGKIDNLAVLVFLIAITPAICEELLFRGLILSGFKRMGMWPAMILSSLLFGLAHASIYRILPTFFLGLLFAYLAWRTGSIVPGMIAHAVNNGLAAVTAARPQWFTMLDAKTLLEFPPWGSAIGSVIVASALWLVTLRTDGANTAPALREIP